MYNVSYKSIQLSKNHTFRAGMDVALSPKHSIGFLVSGTVTDNAFVKDNWLQMSNQGKLDSIINTTSNTDRGLTILVMTLTT
ncbi:hypothetical protein [Mucilaginibacter antarcticus]|uniref:hypothetical protein n=1 Tax=Mucilaginibacter antarcticus TaxID=1855725 RepID=UPI0036280D68